MALFKHVSICPDLFDFACGLREAAVRGKRLRRDPDGRMGTEEAFERRNAINSHHTKAGLGSQLSSILSTSV